MAKAKGKKKTKKGKRKKARKKKERKKKARKKKERKKKARKKKARKKKAKKTGKKRVKKRARKKEEGAIETIKERVKKLRKDIKKKLADREQKESLFPKHKPRVLEITKDLKVLEKYHIKTEDIIVRIEIKGVGNKAILYHISIPKFPKGTTALLDDIRKNLIAEVRITIEEMLDPRAAAKTREKFKKKAELLLEEKIKLEPRTKRVLLSLLMHEMLGLGEIEFLLSDTSLEEVIIPNSREPVRVFHKAYGWLDTDVFVEREEQILNYATIIARHAGRQVSVLNPILDAHIVTGDRANAVLFPISTKGNSITIRKFSRDPWTIVDLINNKTITSELASLLWLGIQYEMNVLVSGGTASGKTSLLNVMMPFIPANQRIITIEQTRELQLPRFLHWCPMVTRLPNPEGKGEVNMLDLLINSLRMRPDRIVLGEIRRRGEAEVLFEAMHTGHSVYATVHADTLAETIARLVNPPISVPENLLGAVNLCAVMFRDRRKGIRRIYQVGEFISSVEGGRTVMKPNIMFRYKPTTDRIISHARSLSFFDTLNRHTGLTMPEINRDLKEKNKILTTMAKKGIRSIEEVGRALYEYYIDKDKVMKFLKGRKLKKVKTKSKSKSKSRSKTKSKSRK